MDDPTIPREELAESLRFIRAVNRRLGGTRAVIAHLSRWSRRWPQDRPITFLDVATGSADIPLAVRRWGVERGFDIRVTAIDNHETTLALAREHIAGVDGIEIAHADALALAERFNAQSFDYVHAGMFLHHLPDIEVLTALRIMDRLARAGIIWNDLVRSRLGVVAIRFLTLGAPPGVRHDARVSVEAGFTPREAREYARRIDLDYAHMRWSLLTHRFTLAGEKSGAWPDRA